MSVPENVDLSQLNDVGAEILRGVFFIKEHFSVDEILNIRLDEETNCVEVKASVRLGLPNRWMAVGASPNKVFAVEPVIFSFPQSFPIHAPTVKLRADFDRSLAHVQPGSSQGPVLPCLYEGNVDELLHAQGLWSIVDQVVAWLEKAAMNQLIDPIQGWEPTRRDILKDLVVADSDYLRSLVHKHRRFVTLPFVYLKNNESRVFKNSSRQHSIYGQIGTHPLRSNFQDVFYERTDTEPLIGQSLALIVTPDKLSSGELCTSDHYLPESVTDLASLKERAKEFRCFKSLDSALSTLQLKLGKLNFGSLTWPIVAVLCIRRPYPLIGEPSEIELVPYIFDVGAPKLLVEGDYTPVFPAAHVHAITPKLLQAFSREQPVLTDQNVVLLGCGSLGSKIAIHMARSGVAPSIVIDKEFLSPHNAARHALLPISGLMDLAWGISKAKALSTAIKGLGQESLAFDEDVTQVTHNSELLRELFPDNTWAVVNTTASLTVRETLASIKVNRLRPRIIETSLFGNGTVGLVTVEGPERNPNSTDLIAQAYDAIRGDYKLKSVVFEGEEPMRRRSVGQGCGSTTMIVSDAKISILAASMSQYIDQMRIGGLPNAGGRILLGLLTDDDMGLKWKSINVPPVHIVSIEGNSSWTVRISECAHRKILQDSAKYSSVETGGILVGRISEAQKAFIVTNVLPAPVDSHRSERGFILGTSGVRAMLQDYSSSCNYSLYCLGTWHSHLSESEPSERDLQTAIEVANSRARPLILLIRTPTNYLAVSEVSPHPSLEKMPYHN